MKNDNEKVKKIQSFLNENAGSQLQTSDFAEQVADTLYGKRNVCSFKKFLFCSKDALVAYDRVKWLTVGIMILVIPVVLISANFQVAENYHFVLISMAIGFSFLGFFEYLWIKTATDVANQQQKWYFTWKKASEEAASESQSITTILEDCGLTTSDFQLATPCIRQRPTGDCVRRILVHFPALGKDSWAVVATTV